MVLRMQACAGKLCFQLCMPNLAFFKFVVQNCGYKFLKPSIKQLLRTEVVPVARKFIEKYESSLPNEWVQTPIHVHITL